MNVLFVCTGNVCRSPMAEGFLRHEASMRGLDVVVRSTGTHAWDGRAATIDGRKVMAELGVPIDDHRTISLSRPLVDWADLVICLATEHQREVVELYRDAAERTYLLKDLIRILPSMPALTADTRAWAASGVRNGASADPDVDDPFGERQEAYRRVANEIRELIAALAAGLQDKTS